MQPYECACMGLVVMEALMWLLVKEGDYVAMMYDHAFVFEFTS